MAGSARMRVAYLCNTFGQPDYDRCLAMADARLDLLTIDWARRDSEYRWEVTEKHWSKHLTLPISGGLVPSSAALWTLLKSLVQFRPEVIIVYGYHNPAFFICAVLFSLFGVSLLTMNDSRFSDYSRTVPIDLLKAMLLIPYRGCLAASRAAADYARFLGLQMVEIYHCAVDVERITSRSRAPYERTAFQDRAFLVVSRFVDKKNLFRLLDAYAGYVAQATAPRGLKLIGYGPLEADIKSKVEASPTLKEHVEIVGYVGVSRVPEYLGAALCLILPSLSDQFGIVVTEALASAVPVIVSSNCGAADLVEPWRNGYIVDPEQVGALTHAMTEIDDSETAWNIMSENALASARAADVSVFLQGIRALLPETRQVALSA